MFGYEVAKKTNARSKRCKHLTKGGRAGRYARLLVAGGCALAVTGWSVETATAQQIAGAKHVEKLFACPRNGPPGTDYVSVLLAVDELEIPDTTDDAGKHFEIRTVIEGVVKAGPNKAITCSIDAQAWYQEFPIPNFYGAGTIWTYEPRYRLRVTNVPRESDLVLYILMKEDDTTIGAINPNDRIDINPARDDWLPLELSPAKGMGRINPALGGAPDVTFGKRKRVMGDGVGAGGIALDFVAGIEFTVTMEDQPEIAGAVPKSGSKSPGLPSGGQPVTDIEEDCRNYAIKAVEDNVEQLKLGCGFQPPTWTNNHEQHFNWCKLVGNNQLAAAETSKRGTALSQCKQDKQASNPPQPPSPPSPLQNNPQQAAYCDTYASEAVRVAVMADTLSCGFSGLRWLQDYSAHHAFCMTQNDAALMNDEHDARFEQYNDCRVRKFNPSDLMPAPMPIMPASDDFIFADSHLRALTAADLVGLSKHQLWQARNEIFARKGYIFSTAKANAYFAAMAWYQPVSKSVSLNANETANVALIKSYE